MTNYTGSLNILGTISADGETANASANLGVALTATINSAGNGSGSETFNGNITLTYTYGGSGSETAPFSLPLTNVQIQSGTFNVSEPVKEFDGINFGVSINGSVNASQTQISETFTATASGTYQGIPLYVTLSGSALLQAAAPPPTPLSISGTAANQTTSDTAPLSLMRNVILTDPNPGQTDTVTVTLSNAANGGLASPAGGTYNPTTGVYTDTGSAAAVTAALDSLVFTPTLNQTPVGQIVTTGFTIHATDAIQQSASDSTTSVKTTEALLGSLNVGQQLELIYIAYFDRAADGGGYTYWEGQNVQAQNGGQNATTTLTGIANAFAPQPETEGLYPSLDPYLGSVKPPPLNTTAGQTALSTFINSVYENLFDRAADSGGETYWVGQLTTGAVALGAAALAIANGATGSDAIEVQNKITVAFDFTTRTSTAGLGQTATLPASFVTAAGTVLKGVDGTSLNDASVTAGKSATTTYISGATGLTVQAETTTNDTNAITITGADQSIDPGTGDHTIQFLAGQFLAGQFLEGQFLAGSSADTLVLRGGGVDQVSGFVPGTDVLDVGALLSGASINLNGDIAALGNYLTITDQGADALLNFDPAGQGGGGTVAVLHGLGGVVTNLDSLLTQNAIRIA